MGLPSLSEGISESERKTENFDSWATKFNYAGERITYERDDRTGRR